MNRPFRPLGRFVPRSLRSDLLRKSALYLIGDLLVRAGSLLLVPVYTRTLAQSDYGAVAIATLVATVVSYFSSISTSAAILKLSPEYDSDHRPGYVVDSVIKFVVVWSILLCGLLLLVIPFVTKLVFRSPDFVPCNRVAVVTGCLSGITSTLLAVFQYSHQPVKYRLVTVCAFAANVATGLVAVLVLKLGGYGAVVGQLMGAMCGCAVALSTSGLKLDAPFEMPVVWRALSIGVPLTVYSIGGFFTDQLSRVFIERYVSAAALGVYNVAFLYCSAVAFVFGAINTAWVPRFFQLPREKSVVQSGFYGTSVIIAAIGMGVIMTLVAPLVIAMIAGRDYYGAAEFVPLLMINAILSGPVWSLLMNPLVRAGRNWCIAWCAVASGTCNLLLNPVLTLRFAAWGAALSSTISLAFLIVLAARYSSKIFPIDYNIKAIIAVGAVAVASCAVVLTAEVAGMRSGVQNVLAAALNVVVVYWAFHREWLKVRGSSRSC